MTSRLALAKQNLADVVKRQWPERDALLEKVKHIFHDPKYAKESSPTDMVMHSYRLQEYNPSRWFFLPKNTPEIIGKGTHSVVLDVGHGFVAKFHPSKKLRCFGTAEVDGQYIVHVTNAIEEEGFLFETIRSLRELGFHVPFHTVVGIELAWSAGLVEIIDSRYEGRGSFVIATDLRKNGKYVVVEPENATLLSLKNGDELNASLDAQIKLLMDLFTKYQNSFLPPSPHDPRYVISPNEHVTKDGPQEAFRHMFLLQVDPYTAKGSLVLGDLSGVIIQNVERRHGKA